MATNFTPSCSSLSVSWSTNSGNGLANGSFRHWLCDWSVADAYKGTFFSLHARTTRRQVVDFTFNYLQANPELRHQAAKNMVGTAFLEAFPCENKAK